MDSNLSLEIDPDGIALIVWDMPGRRMNVLSRESIEDFGRAVEEVIANPRIKGAIVTSRKDAFLAGADLETIDRLIPDASLPMPEQARHVFNEVMILQNLYRRLETGGKPFVAAINGTALGGGFELCLACHYRVASDAPRLQLGLPEGKIGLLPGAGGTQRTLRMIGIERALPLLQDGATYPAEEALKLGLIDRIVPADGLIGAAKEWLSQAGQGAAIKPWDQPGFVVPGLNPRSAAGADKLALMYAMQRKKTQGNYPAQDQIQRAVYEGSLLPFDKALRVETWCFTRCVLSPVALNIIRTQFLNLQKANRLERRPPDVPKQAITKIGVLGGGGMMGAAIAHVAAQSGMEVVLIDRDQATAERGVEHVRQFHASAIAKGRMDARAVEAIVSRITPTTRYELLADAPLVIEAVFEDRDVKADVVRKSEAVLSADAIFASNTSTLPITSLAEASRRPEQFVGMHFFSPVERMRLVEVIPGRRTGAKALAVAMDFTRQISKTPIVVTDSRGFYTSRVFTTYWHEALCMLAEGVAPALIESAGRLSGMPVPPLSLCDEVTLELLHKINVQTAKDLGPEAVATPGMRLLARLVEQEKRIGRKTGAGFYDYSKDGQKRLWPGLARVCPVTGQQPPVEELRDRLLDAQALEAVRSLESSVIASPADGDVASFLGWNFAPWTGGPFSYVDMTGASTFHDRCLRRVKAHGEHHRPPALLASMAKNHETFYSASSRKTR